MPPPKTTEPSQPSQEETTPEAYEAARTALIAKLPPVADRPTSIYGKLALITGLIGQVRKSGRNEFHKYNYAKESDLVEAVRPLLSELGLWVWWTLHSDPTLGFVPHQRLNISRRRDGETTEADSLTVITGQFKFFDDKGASSEPQIIMGYGDDTSDKGLGKAYTNMEKSFLMKSFLVSTGDDPEADPRTDQRAARREQGSAPRVDVQRGQGRAAAPGGRQAEASNPQISQLGQFTRKAGITSALDAITIYEKILDPIKVEPIDPEDIAESLKTWLHKQDGPTMGRLIHDIRTLAEAKGTSAETPSTAAETPSTAAPVETTEKDVESFSDGKSDVAASDQTEPDPSLVGEDDVE